MADGPRKTGRPRPPRVLVTGFGPFPGATDNPSERLIGALAAGKAVGDTALRLEVLPVEYRAVPERLEAFGREFAPDIAIHFGLSLSASGFRLERVARNGTSADKPDNAGACGFGPIRAGAGDFPSSLPLAAIFDALKAAGLPAAYSDDAGGYLCNYVFYLSRGHLCDGFAPSMAGFVHVPPLHTGLTLDELVAGAVAIIDTCRSAWAAPRSLVEGDTARS